MKHIFKKVTSAALATMLSLNGFTIAPVHAEETDTLDQTETAEESDDTVDKATDDSETYDETSDEKSSDVTDESGEARPTEGATGDSAQADVPAESDEAAASEETTDSQVMTPSQESEASLESTADPAENTQQEMSSVSDENKPDFSSGRLIIATDDKSKITDKDQVIGDYNGVYILQFKNADKAEKAYEYYLNKVNFVEPDTLIVSADNKDASSDVSSDSDIKDTESGKKQTEDNNSLARLDDLENPGLLTKLKNAVTKPKQADIALIDTGADCANVIRSVSVIGDDASDDNGHGTKIAEIIKETAPDAKILSIKALASDGSGTMSSVYSAMEYAISQKVKVINLSLYGKASEQSKLIEKAVADAKKAGITVVGAAGNDNADTINYTPGNIDDVIVVGACDKDDNKIASSNYGDTVDYYAVANSTSEASAYISALTANGADLMADSKVFENVNVDGLSGSTKLNEADGNGTVNIAEDSKAYAVYFENSDNNYELDFIRSTDSYTSANESKSITSISGKKYTNVSAIYSDFETKTYTHDSTPPWKLAIETLDNGQSHEEVSVKFIDEIKPVSTSWWFGINTSSGGRYSWKSVISSIDFNGHLDTSRVTDMSLMFYNCKNLTSLDVSNWNTSNVTNMSSMFLDCNNLTSLDVSKWDTSNVTDMQDMIRNCKNLTSLDVSKWDTSKVTDMNYMFDYCNKLTNLDVSKWDTSRVTDMRHMFYCCNKLTNLDVSKWDTSKVTHMEEMFRDCNNLTSLDLSNWDTSKVTDMEEMFCTCSALTNIKLSSKFNTKNVTDMHSMFDNCSSLTSLDLRSFDVSSVFVGYSKHLSHNGFDTMFYYCHNLTTIYANADWTKQNSYTNASEDVFSGCNKLKGAIEYNYHDVDMKYANPTTGYFTAKAFSVSFNCNGGTGSMSVQTPSTIGGSVTLANNAFRRSGYTFKEWNTKKDGSGTSYANGASVTPTEDMTLYAQWEKVKTYTVKFNKNGADGTSAMNDESIHASLPTKLTKNTFTYSHHKFTGWNTKADGTGKSYSDEQEVTDLVSAGESITLYAQWSYKTFAVNLTDGNGNVLQTVTATYGSTMPDTLDKTKLPSKKGYTFDGYEDSSHNKYYDGNGKPTNTKWLTDTGDSINLAPVFKYSPVIVQIPMGIKYEGMKVGRVSTGKVTYDVIITNEGKNDVTVTGKMNAPTNNGESMSGSTVDSQTTPITTSKTATIKDSVTLAGNIHNTGTYKGYVQYTVTVK